MSTRRIAARPATMWGVYTGGGGKWWLWARTVRDTRAESIAAYESYVGGAGAYDYDRRHNCAIALRVTVRPADSEGA